jgi:hypothetical protein
MHELAVDEMSMTSAIREISCNTLRSVFLSSFGSERDCSLSLPVVYASLFTDAGQLLKRNEESLFFEALIRAPSLLRAETVCVVIILAGAFALMLRAS